MKRKTLSLALVISTILFMIVGCAAEKKPNTPPETTEKPPATNQPTTGTETEKETEKPNVLTYKDGQYKAELEPDEHQWKSIVELQVQDGKITDVYYDELDEKDNKKSEDEEYNEQWENASNISAQKAYPQLEKSLIESQDIENVDTVTGATDATRDFKEVVTKALKDAIQ